MIAAEQRSSRDDVAGRTVANRFELLEALACGGAATVYRALECTTGREIALKVLDPRRTRRPEIAVLRFLRGARLASLVRHANVMAVFDAGQAADGMVYLAAELIRGRTLRQLLVCERRLPLDGVVLVGSQILGGLAALHQLGIVHRNLKLANAMMSDLPGRSGSLRLIDFDLATSPLVCEADAMSVGNVIGTPAYMSPEAARAQPIDARSDLYSAGVMLYELATGHLPFEGRTVGEVLSGHLVERPPPLVAVPPATAAFIMRLLSKDPAQRPQDALRARDELLRAAWLDRR